ncbi:sodium/hydrogen exchanger 8 isoform X2 [Physcomitrium patens]|uniref:Putative Na/H antiporter n=1 Tax=Physcomitrium patens TaxID=3218 RepID=Q7XB48_PHYPA|nr:sodium/hydrogen exchanger 8-like isoform X2 [Physcomitrium patens]CAD91921.1 putative Na/H antiporter [Physcomitrium patens]CAM96566.1 SOS1 putative Na+/H+ antiporter [Physcomitrium patens]|eukprot:XP_024361415.1 sodium/hydrogen exchanger 8-like isoform X2 [Physcomitrella patens]
MESMSTVAPAPSTAATEEVGPEVAILFVGVALFLGMVSRHLFKGSRIPYTVVLLLLGIGIGGLEYGVKNLGVLGDSIRMWSNIDPDLILFLFLPALLFESSFAMDFHQIKRCFFQMLLLAAPGVLISTFLLGVATVKVFPYNWNWSTGLLLGGLLSATDPVAVVALLKELGASKKLSTLIEGESLMNDGTAIVVFRLFLQMVLGKHFSAGDVVSFLSRVVFGAVALGLLFGIVSVIWVGRVFNDTVIEITLTLTASYMAFFVAEESASVSGVLTVMTVGIFFTAFARTAFTGESAQSMHHFWEMISYIANTLVFLLSGVVIAESILRSQDKIQGRDWGYLLLLYLFVQISRAMVVGLLYPGLKYFGYGINWKEAIVLIWAGLRGAVALSLSLSVAQVGQHDPTQNTYLSKLTEARFVFFTGGVVLLTLIINGSTTQFLLLFLKMDTITETKSRMLEFAKYEMYSKALEAFGELGDDEELGPADWNTIRKYVSCLSYEENKPTHPHGPPSFALPDGEYAKQQMTDTRTRFLNGLQAAYWNMLDEGRITQTAALILMQSIDEALDKVKHHTALQDWEGLRPHIHFPGYLKYFSWRSTSVLPRRASTYFLIQQLELACYIAAAFLRAHRMTRNHLRDFIGESEVTEAVIQESEAQAQHARLFLEDVRLSFPQVLRAVKAKQVTHAILLHLTTYVESLENAGLFESKEAVHLHDAVQIDLKKLLRDPPIVEMPSAEQTLQNQPFIGAMPTSVQKPLLDVSKEYMKLQGSVIYREDMKSDGIWLITNGVVKWSKKAVGGQRLRQPTFSFGSTLGLYEVLTGKPYLCDVVADSVVHCFFVERSRILFIQKERADLEDFLWQESALAVAKIVLGPQFDMATLQDIRALVMEGSSMRIFLRGEVFELRHKEMGLLLEGFVRQENSTELITAPAGLTAKILLPSPTGSWSNISLQQPTVFHAEARSRVLLFESSKVGEILSQGSSQLLAVPRKTSRSMLRLSSKTSTNTRTKVDRHSSHNEIRIASDHSIPIAQAWGSGSSCVPDKYTAKALEISVFGSEVDVRDKRRADEIPLDAQSRFTQSHSNLVKRVSLMMQERFDNKQTSMPKRKIASQENMTVPMSLLPHQSEPKPDDSSDDSDKEEHIVRIDSPSFLFHNSRREL